MTDEDLFEMCPQTAQATGYPVGSSFLVMRGSTAMRDGSPKEKRNRQERDRLIMSGVLVQDHDPDLLRFTKDHLFGSSSTAGGVIKDGNCSGPQSWKRQSDGKPLKAVLDESVIVFEKPTSDADELRNRVVRVSKALHDAETKGLKLPEPAGKVNPGRESGTTFRFVRDPNVIAWVLHTSQGSCEVCGEEAPFRKDDGAPYLEVHHVRPLGEGGPDTTDNTVACCPNCHRKLHYASDRMALRSAVIRRISRLADHPVGKVTEA
ncbi:DUF4357 domain-containing protein [Thioclava sp. GXIMD4215]|uniref:DUF4357 domain-containing protein n=1 Tax=Thioclava sp. GXIMD4215 TaxID=3131928 RepID=UPI00311B146B